MISKLKCPFCGEELDPRFDAYHETITSWVCINEKCVSFDWEFPPKAWQVLIQSQRDLQDKKEELEEFKKHHAMWEQIRNNTILALEKDLQIAKQALVEIRDEALSVNRYRIIADANHALAQINHNQQQQD